MNNGVRISRIEKEIKNDIISADLLARLDPNDLPWIEKMRRHLLAVYGVVVRSPQDITTCKLYCEDVAHSMTVWRKYWETNPDASEFERDRNGMGLLPESVRQENLSGYSLEYQKYLHEKSKTK